MIIAADPKHLGARIGVTLVLHTWGSAMTHHPHVHGIVPGGGLSLDGERWIASKPGFFLPVRVLSRLFRRLFLEKLCQAYQAGLLQFFAEHQALAKPEAFTQWLKPLRQCEWVVYAKRPFAGPSAVLSYLSRYTHRVAIANSRIISLDEQGVTFKWKDYRAKGRTRYKAMTLTTDEFIRRFLLHVLPSGLHRIRHYGLFANAGRQNNLTRARELLCGQAPQEAVETLTSHVEVSEDSDPEPLDNATFICPECGAPMIAIELIASRQWPRAPPKLNRRDQCI
jgi:hypothetical protein